MTENAMVDVKPGKIFESLNGVMKDIGAIGKNKKNTQQNFTYRGIDDIYNALQPALVANGVIIAPEVIEEKREERQTQKGGVLFYTRLTVIHTFYATDGSYIKTRVIGEAMDSGDKASNKALSIAYKYACFQMFCIPTEELQDPDATSPEPALKEDEEAANQRMVEEAGNAKISTPMLKVLKDHMLKKGVTEEKILDRYHVEKLEDLTVRDFTKAQAILDKMPDKEPEQLDLGL